MYSVEIWGWGLILLPRSSQHKMHFLQDIKIVNWHNQGQVNLALREAGSTSLRLSILRHSLSPPFPLLLSPFCLPSAAEGKPKAPTTHGASSAAVKQRCQEPKRLFSSSAISCGWALGWHQGPGLMSARELL